MTVAYNFWMKNPFIKKRGYENARFHQISTDEVYGSIEQGSFDEGQAIQFPHILLQKQCHFLVEVSTELILTLL